VSNPSTKRLLKAQWLYTGASPLQRDAAVVTVNDRIFSTGSAKTLEHDHPDASIVDLGNAIIIRALNNAHTHLELSNAIRAPAPSSFVDWLLSMPRREANETDASANARVAAATRLGIDQCLKFGVTCVGDISQQMQITRPVLRDSPLRAISYGEVIGLGKRRWRFEQLLPLALSDEFSSERLTIGLSPHSPYTVEPGSIRRCLAEVSKVARPLAIHLAETPDEEEFLRSHTGPLRELFERLGSWEDFPERFDGTPVAFAAALGLLDGPTRLVHVNYCSDDDLALLAKGLATVIYCPRTHKYFGHPPHRWRDMIERGVNVTVGTDSCASSPDQLRLLHEIAPDWPVEKIWEMATSNAWQWDQTRRADFAVFPVSTDDPLREILEDRSRLPREVWIAGVRITNTPPASPC